MSLENIPKNNKCMFNPRVSCGTVFITLLSLFSLQPFFMCKKHILRWFRIRLNKKSQDFKLSSENV